MEIWIALPASATIITPMPTHWNAAMRSRRRLLAVACALALLGSAQAQLTPVTWIAATGDWATPANWSSAVVPGAGHIATVASGTVTVSAATAVGALVLSGGTLDGNSLLELMNTGSVWSSGTMTGSGTTRVASSGSLAINTGNPILNGRSLSNSGIVDFAPATSLVLSGSGTITNNNLWNFQNNTSFSGATSSYTFLNSDDAGVLRKTTATGTLSFNISLNNAGQVGLDGGTFSIDGGGSATGFFDIAGSGILQFNSDFSLNPGSDISGIGSIRINNGILTLARGSAFAPSLPINLVGGTLTGADAIQIGNANPLTWSGGNMTGSGLTQVLGGGTLTLNAASLITNARSITNAGTVNFTPAFDLILSGTGTLANTGVWNFQNNASFTNGSYVFENLPGGSVNKTTGSGSLFFNIPFNNSGSVSVSGGTLDLAAGGSSNGTFATGAEGLIKFNSNYALNVGSSFAANSNVQLASGTLTLASGYTFKPAFLSFSGGTLAGAGAWEVPLAASATWSGGTLTGTGATTVNGQLTIAGGDPTISGRNLTNQGSLVFAPDNFLSVSGDVAIVNAPFALFELGSAGTFSRAGGIQTFQNQANATVHMTTEGSFNFSLPVTNAGNFIISSGTLLFSSTFTHTAGNIVLENGSTAQFSSGLNVAAGVLAGSGTIVGNVTSSGLLSPGSSPGQLNIVGDLSLLGISLFEIGGTVQGSGYDFVNVSGTATLGGNLHLVFVNGFQNTILPTDTFSLLSAGLRSSTFLNAPSSGLRIFTSDGLGSFQIDYTGITVNLSNFVAVPEPSTWVLLLTGSLLVTFQLRRRRS